MLKSGKTVEGRILEKTDKYVKIDFEDVTMTYFLDEIDSIDGKKLDGGVVPVGERTSEIKVPAAIAEVNVYLNTGEVIRGKLVEKTDTSLVIEKQGNTLTFKNGEVSKVEDGDIINNVSQPRKLPFSTAIIIYKFSGAQSGKGEVDIDVAGNRVNKSDLTSVSFGGQVVIHEARKMYDGKAYYDFIPKEKTVVREEKKVDALSEIYNEKMFVDYYTGEEKFLGKDCKVYKMPTGTFLFWNGIELKEDVKVSPLGSYLVEAVEIKTDVLIPEDKFSVPAGVKVLTTEEAMKAVQMMFKGLGDKMNNIKSAK